MNWNLFGCARRGHVTYAPDEPALRDRWGSRPRPERPGGACAAARHRPASPVMPSPL